MRFNFCIFAQKLNRMKNNIKETISIMGITQKTLAQLTGMSEVGISKAINGTATPNTIRRIADAIGVDEQSLIISEEPQLKSKYEGVLKIGNAELEVAVLENGQRIITQAAVFRAFDRPARGNSRLVGIPTFMDAKNLQPYVNDETLHLLAKVEYIDIHGGVQQGFDCKILPMVCDLYLKAREDDVLMPNQLQTARKAEALVRSLAKVGIVALVDEATGYYKDKERAKDELQNFLNKFLSEEASRWVKTFSDQFFEDLYRMHNWSWTKTAKRPGIVGKWINDIVYERIGPMILKELQTRNPKNDNGNRKYKHHQLLSSEIGKPRLQQHLEALHALAIVSNYKWGVFMKNIDKAYPRQYQELDLFIDEDYE